MALTLPVVCGGRPTWAPRGKVRWDRWGGTAPSWDLYENFMDSNAVEWPMRTPGTVVAVAQAAAGTWAHNGPVERRLEAQLRRRMGALDVAMVSSGTAALKVKYRALMAWARLHGREVEGVPEVIMTAMSFKATADAAVDAGLKPVMVDVERRTLQPSTAAIRAAITRSTVGIEAVPLYLGTPRLDEWRALADRERLWLGADDAQGPFARYKGKPLEVYVHGKTSSLQYGKEYTSGEGGTVSSNVPLVIALMREGVVGKAPAADERPAWWPTEELAALRAITEDGVEGIEADNVRYDEFKAAVAEEQLRIFRAQARHKEAQYARIVEEIRRRGLPFSLVERGHASGFLYKLPFWNETRVPTEALLVAARLQMTGEWGPPYVPMSDPASGFKWQTIPWQVRHLGLSIDRDAHPVAVDVHARVMLLAGNELLRQDAAEHVIHTLMTLAAHEDELVAWWARLNRS